MSVSPANITIADNGSIRSIDYDDIYFMPKKAIAESQYVFIQASNFTATQPTNVLELGFGTGLNFLLTLYYFRENPQNLNFISIEKHPIKKDDLIKVYATFPNYLSDYCSEIIAKYPNIQTGTYELNINGATLTLYFDDVKNCIGKITDNIDSIYLDGFNPRKNVDMWGQQIFKHCQKILNPNGIITTFSAASAVQNHMRNNKLFVKKRCGFGNKRECLVATKYPVHIPDNVKNIAVVGAGITGLTLAYELDKSGFNVTLYDKNGILSGASGNPYALIDPRFLNGQTGDALFNQYAYLYGLDFYDKMNCWAVQGLTKHQNARIDCKRLQAWTKLQNIDSKHIVNTNTGIELPTSGAVDTQKLADILSAKITFKAQKITNANELNDDLILFCCGAETNEIADIPYTINRGVIGTTQPIQNKKQAVSKIGYFINTDDMTLFGATTTRVNSLEPYTPTHRDKDELIKQVADIIQINPEQNITLRYGYRCNTKQRIPNIKQLNSKTFAILGMGARGYTNAPYTAYIFKNLLLRNITDLNHNILKALTI